MSKTKAASRWHWRFDTPEKYQTMMKNYYRLGDRSGHHLRARPGRTGEAGAAGETRSSSSPADNGYFHGEHGLADKWYPHEESIRVPLIVRDPRLSPDKAGRTNDDFALNVDLAPTILAAAGIKAPATMQGREPRPALPRRDEARVAQRVFLRTRHH